MLDRRHFLAFSAGSATMFSPGRLRAEQGEGDGRVAFRLKELAGLRRFSYPVHATLPIRDIGPNSTFRLLRGGKVVPAQFSRVNSRDGRSAIALDFTASPGPFEIEDYTISYGAGAKPGAEPSRGLVAERQGGLFRISNAPYLTYSIPEDLSGLVSSIRTPDLEFLTPESRGLFLTDRKSGTRSFLKLTPEGGRRSADWSRKGSFAVGLKFDGTVSPSGRALLRTTVELTFVQSKSWIETRWSVEDPEDLLGSMGVDLAMKVDGLPSLVDCGASSTVYSHLRNGETLSFTGSPPAAPGGSPSWSIEQGPGDARKPFAVAPATGRPAEGWIHLMDQTRCSALALADFAVTGSDRFLIDFKGRTELERRFLPTSTSDKPPSRKILQFWLHVVPMPVQVGAVTSPQAMLSPLAVEWNG